METAEAVRVGKFAEGAELVVSERRLELEFRFEECHGTSIAERRNVGTFARLNVESSRLGLRRLTLRRREEGSDLTQIGSGGINRGRGYRR